MTDEQRRIVESFPKEDRGEINPNSTDAADFEDDFVVAHVKRGLARQIEMKERRAERRDMLGEYGNEEEDEDEYLDSEEEYKCELDFRAQSKKEHWEEKEQNQIGDNVKVQDVLTDNKINDAKIIRKETKDNQKYKAADGVKFV